MSKSFTFIIFLLGILIARIACEGPTEDQSSPSETSNAPPTEDNSSPSETPNAQLKEDESSPSESSNAPAQITNTPNNEPDSAPATAEQPKTDDTAPWILSGFNKRLNKKGKKCWKSHKYHVCLTKYPDTTKLYWKNKESNAEVDIEISNEGEKIVQSWKYQNADVQLNLNEDGSSVQQWKFGPSDNLQVNGYSDGTSKSEWLGSEHPEEVEQFKKFIDSWCENNDFFVGKENCVIYDKTNANNAPWSLTRFNKNKISHLGKSNSKCWINDRYHVCLTKYSYVTKLYWKNKKSNAEVDIESWWGGEDIIQTWKYENADVQLTLKKDGSRVQQWNFGSSDKLQVNVYPDETNKTEWFGSEHPEEVEKFKKFIDSWCENNDFFVGKENCSIYQVPIPDTDPAWILTGFDKNQVSEVNDGSKCWKNSKYDVCFTKTESEKKLYWENKGKATVDIYMLTGGIISQEWWYKHGYIQIYRREDGTVEQIWSLRLSTFEIKKVPGGTAESKWEGDEDLEELKKYQEFIDAWCENNDFFVTKDECLIYKI